MRPAPFSVALCQPVGPQHQTLHAGRRGQGCRSLSPSAPRALCNSSSVTPSSSVASASPRTLRWNRTICAALPNGKSSTAAAPSSPCKTPTRSSAEVAASMTASTTSPSRGSSAAAPTTSRSAWVRLASCGAVARVQSVGPHPSAVPSPRRRASATTASRCASTVALNAPSAQPPPELVVAESQTVLTDDRPGPRSPLRGTQHRAPVRLRRAGR